MTPGQVGAHAELHPGAAPEAWSSLGQPKVSLTLEWDMSPPSCDSIIFINRWKYEFPLGVLLRADHCRKGRAVSGARICPKRHPCCHQAWLCWDIPPSVPLPPPLHPHLQGTSLAGECCHWMDKKQPHSFSQVVRARKRTVCYYWIYTVFGA